VLLGASGFVGSAILKEALDCGHLVTAAFIPLARNSSRLSISAEGDSASKAK
jgi:putative NADH-flavin reductase